MPTRLVTDLLKTQTLRTVKPEFSLRMCTSLMHANNISRIPVVCSDGFLVGIISERDVRLALSIPYFNTSFLSTPSSVEILKKLTAKDIMTEEQKVVSVKLDATVIDAIKLMSVRGVRGLPVVGEDKKLVGLITHNDLLDRLLSLEMESEENVKE